MPHAALWVVQRDETVVDDEIINVSMPHAALWVVQHTVIILVFCKRFVSMPHAALWVVQQCMKRSRGLLHWRFQCRTRLCGWCNKLHKMINLSAIVSMPHAALWVVQLRDKRTTGVTIDGFNAARGFVGGATASLAALVPLGGKSPFGKSPKI